MLSIIASIFETTLMVMEPAYRTYKELKSENSPENRPDSRTSKRPESGVDERPGSKTGDKPGTKSNKKPGSKKGEMPGSKKGKVTDSANTERSESGDDEKKVKLDGGITADKTVDNKVPTQRQLLLMHWIVYAAFHFADCLTRPWLPLFPFFSVAAIVWLRAGGTELIYRNIVEPYFIENEPRIDKWMDDFNQLKTTVVNSTGVLHNAIVNTDGKTDAADIQRPPSSGITEKPRTSVVKPGSKNRGKKEKK